MISTASPPTTRGVREDGGPVTICRFLLDAPAATESAGVGSQAACSPMVTGPRRSSPSGSTRNISLVPASPRVKAIRAPSGDQAGSVSLSPSFTVT